nr:N-acetylglucosamine-6-phosphate deacetylase [bacterium]
MGLTFTGAHVWHEDGFQKEDLHIREGRIAPQGGGRVVRLDGCIVAPGYVDLHIHGAAGVDCIDGGDSILHMARALARHGVTGFLPSLMSAPVEQMHRAHLAAAAYMDSGVPGGARVMGVHLEGPFLNPVRAGAQPMETLLAPTLENYRAIVGNRGDAVRRITLAPELPQAETLIRRLVADGVTVSMGHTDATQQQVLQAISWGVTNATHLFNAMRPLHHREPGPAGVALTHPGMYVELICDNIHLDATVSKLARMAAGNRCVLVTDAMMAACMPEGDGYELSGQRVVVKDGAARLKDTGNLAGSILTLDRAVRNIVAAGETPHRAIGMVAVNPRRANGLPGGVIAPGQIADLVVLDDALEVLMTLVGGQVVYRRGDAPVVA